MPKAAGAIDAMVVIAVVGTTKTVAMGTILTKNPMHLHSVHRMTPPQCPAIQRHPKDNLDLPNETIMERVNLDPPIATVDPHLPCVLTNVITTNLKIQT